MPEIYVAMLAKAVVFAMNMQAISQIVTFVLEIAWTVFIRKLGWRMCSA